MKKNEFNEIDESPLGSIYDGFEEYLENKYSDKYPPFEKERITKIEKIKDYNDKVFQDAVSYGFYTWLFLIVALTITEINNGFIYASLSFIIFVAVYSGLLSKKYPPELETRESFLNWKRIKRIAARKKEILRRKRLIRINKKDKKVTV